VVAKLTDQSLASTATARDNSRPGHLHHQAQPHAPYRSCSTARSRPRVCASVAAASACSGGFATHSPSATQSHLFARKQPYPHPAGMVHPVGGVTGRFGGSLVPVFELSGPCQERSGARSWPKRNALSME
jgi:hypothetical protein